MHKNFSIKISDFTGIFRAMAEKANENGDDILDYNETSVFNAIRKTHNKRNNTFIYNNTIFNEKGHECNFIMKEKTDALRFENPYTFEKIREEEKNQIALKKADLVPAANMNDINSITDPKYKDIIKAIRGKIGNRYSEQKANEVATMVIRLCKKYEIHELSPLIAHILGYETGGFVFNKEKMNPEGKKYKGVMQVDFLTCQCIFSEGPQKNKDWHDKHFSQDNARIEELRNKYGNAKNLYEAMKTDVKLGLEVGIIAYKAKLHEAKGNVAVALHNYCGGDYTYPFNNIPKQFNV